MALRKGGRVICHLQSRYHLVTKWYNTYGTNTFPSEMTMFLLFHSRRRSTSGELIEMGTYKRGRYTKVRPGEKIPNKPGAERWVSKKTGKVVYQGESSNIGNRIAQQKRDKMPYTRGNYEAQYKVADGRSTSNTRRKHEKKKIAQHNPRFNKSSGGEGRRANGGSGRRPNAGR